MFAIWTCRILALISAFGVGYFLGYSVPGWREDEQLDNAVEGQRYAGYGGSLGSRGAGCFSSLISAGLGTPDSTGAKAYSIVLFIMVLVFAAFGFGAPEGMGEEYGEIMLLFYTPFWMILGCNGVGYIYARITDRGPVGPIE